MKQKFVLVRDDKKNTLTLKEYAELDKEVMSLLCEETYDGSTIQSAMQENDSALIAALRTKNMYPPTMYATKIVEGVRALYSEGQEEQVEVLINDMELLADEQAQAEFVADISADSDDIDNLLDDDEVDDDFENDITIQKISSSLKVADDDLTDLEEEA